MEEDEGKLIMINPKQLAATSLDLLEEAILTILYIEPSDLKPDEIGIRLGIDKELYRYKGRANPIVESVLRKLKREERVEPDKCTYGKWQLTESERRERDTLLTTPHS